MVLLCAVIAGTKLSAACWSRRTRRFAWRLGRHCPLALAGAALAVRSVEGEAPRPRCLPT